MLVVELRIEPPKMGGGPRWQDYAKALQENDRTIFLNQRLPLKFYYRTANELLKQVSLQGGCREVIQKEGGRKEALRSLLVFSNDC